MVIWNMKHMSVLDKNMAYNFSRVFLRKNTNFRKTAKEKYGRVKKSPIETLSIIHNPLANLELKL